MNDYLILSVGFLLLLALVNVLGYIDNKDPNRFGNALYDLNIMKTTVPPESPEDFVLFDDVMDEQEAKDITRNFFKNRSTFGTCPI